MTTFAKIGTCRGIVGPMHWHEPYGYWQWPFEAHSKPGSAHALHDVEHPIWVGRTTTNPTKPGVATITPSADEKAAYAQALDPTSALSVEIKKLDREQRKAAAQAGIVAEQPVAPAAIEVKEPIVVTPEAAPVKERRTGPRELELISA